MAAYTNIPDRAVQKLGFRDAFALCLVYRYQRRKQGKFNASVDKKAKYLRLSPNTLRAALHRLRRDGYIHDLTPNARNRPHDYVLTELGLSLASENWSPKSGHQDLATTNWSPNLGDEEYNDSSTKAESTKALKNTVVRTAATAGQMVLTENHDAQNLGALDIETQKCLNTLGINPDIEQATKAPTLTRGRSPAEVLMFHDDGSISENLGRWRAAYDDGAEITWKPTLIWWKIVELQPPPVPEPEPAEAEAWAYEGVLT